MGFYILNVQATLQNSHFGKTGKVLTKTLTFDSYKGFQNLILLSLFIKDLTHGVSITLTFSFRTRF